MIDLRCQLFDGTVCGAEDFAAAVSMCRRAIEEGVRTIVATERWDAVQDELPRASDEYQNRLERLRLETGSVLTFKRGFLLRFHTQLPLILERCGTTLTLGGGRHVLVSLPALKTPDETEEVWEQLRLMGFRVVLAGAECSPALRRNPERLEQWLASGLKLQLNAASITGRHGRQAQSFAFHCAREYRSQTVVASNARACDSHSPSLGLARELLTRQLGRRWTHALFEELPSAILEPLTDESAQKRKPREQSGLLRQLFRFGKAATGT